MVRRKKIENSGTENKEEATKSEPTNSDIMEAIMGLGKRVSTLETKEADTFVDDGTGARAVPHSKSEERRQTVTREAYQAKGFVPRDFRQIVDDLLGPEYGLEVQDFTDSMDFQIMVIVPDDIALKAKALTPDNIALGMRDTRTKVVPRALGVNGVRDWVTKVRENLAKAFAQNGVASPLN